jgi:fatty-acyl-CoA synthase
MLTRNPTSTTSVLADILRNSPPEAIALEYRGELRTYGELVYASERLATSLAARGIRSGDRVAIWLPNIFEWFVAAFGCYRLGATHLSLNLRLTGREVGEFISRTRAAVLVCMDGADCAIDRGQMKSLRLIVCPGDKALSSEGGGLHRVGLGWLGRQKEAVSEQHAMPASEAVVLPTSGTTGKPKLVVHTQASVTRHMHDVAFACGFHRAGVRTLAVLPVCGGFGYTAAMATLCGGGAVVLAEPFDPVLTGLALRDQEITHVLGTNDMLDKMLDATDSDRPFPYLRMFGHANFVPQLSGLANKALAKGVYIRGMYGMTELMAGFAVQPDGADLSYRDQAGGYPVSAGTVVRIIDPETGIRVQPGTSGEIEVKTPNRMKAYLDDEAATAAVLTPDGYFRTGDLGWMRADGAVVFESRSTDAMRVGGYLVSPTEIEELLLQDPSVEQCQVVAVSIAASTRPVAFVVPRANMIPDPNKLLARCKDALAPFKRPVRIYTVEGLPLQHGPNGSKVQRHVLREWASQRLGTAG